MATQVLYEDLVQQMVGKDTLNGWDVLVTYDETKVNELLKARAALLSGVTTMPAFTSNIQLPGVPFAIDTTFNLNFNDPLLQFSGAQGMVDVSFAMTGTSSTTYNGVVSTSTLPEGLRLVSSTALVNVAGFSPDNSTTFVPDPKKATGGANHVVMLDPGADELHNICIDFSKPNCRVIDTSAAASSSNLLAAYNSLLLSDIEQHFCDAGGLKYYLAGITNVFESSNPDSDVLRPTKFCFTSVLGDSSKNIPGALCIWIAVKGGNGNDVSGVTQLSFHPDSIDVHPIPMYSSASVIFSHDLIANQCTGFGDLTHFNVTSVKSVPGMTFTCQFPVSNDNHIVISPQNTWSENDPLHDLYNWIMDGIDCGMSAGTLAITLSPTVPSVASLSWTSDEQAMSWKVLFGVAQVLDSQGTTRVTFQFNGSASWTGSSTDSPTSPNLLTLGPFNLDEFYNTNISQDSVDLWQQIRNTTSCVTPPQFDNTRISVPALSLSMKPLDYFLTTNLLFPGTHMFVADPPSRLATPRDMILTGSVGKVNHTPSSVLKATAKLAQSYLDSGLITSGPRKGLLGAVTGPTAMDFIAALLKSDTILPSLYKAISLDDLSVAGATISAILDDNGYGHLTGDDISQVYGYDSNTMLNLYSDTSSNTNGQMRNQFTSNGALLLPTDNPPRRMVPTARINGLPVSSLPVSPLRVNLEPNMTQISTNSCHQVNGRANVLEENKSPSFHTWCPYCCPCSCHIHAHSTPVAPNAYKPAATKTPVLPRSNLDQAPTKNLTTGVVPSAARSKTMLGDSGTTTSTDTPISPDLLLFSGSYTISEPADRAGQQLQVLNDIIDYDGFQVKPVTTLDPTNHTVTAVWTNQTNNINTTYNIVFSVALVKGSPVVPYFDGTLVVDGSPSQNFKGQWPQPGTTGVLPGNSDAVVSVSLTIIGTFCGLPTWVGFILQCYCMYKDHQRYEREKVSGGVTADITKVVQDTVGGIREELKQQQTESAMRIMRRALKDGTVRLTELEGHFKDVLLKASDDPQLGLTKAEIMQLADEISGVKGAQGLDTSRKNDIYAAVEKIVQDTTTKYFQEQLGGLIANHQQDAIDQLLTTDQDREDCSKKVVEASASALLEKADKAATGSFSKALADHQIIDQAILYRQKDSTKLDSRALKLQSRRTAAETAQKMAEKNLAECVRKIKAEKANKNPLSDGQTLNDLQEAQKEFQKEVDNAKIAATDARTAAEGNAAKIAANNSAMDVIDGHGADVAKTVDRARRMAFEGE